MELRTSLSLVSSFFALLTTILYCLIMKAMFGSRRAYYRSHFFYVIYMVGSSIDVVALTSCHLLALLPSNGLFLDAFLSSTVLGRLLLFFAWSTRACQELTNLFIAINRATAITAPVFHRKFWSLKFVRVTCFLVQFGIGTAVGGVAASLDVYWCNPSGSSWYIQFFDIPSTHRFFLWGFILISSFSSLTLASYAVLLHNFRSIYPDSKHQSSSVRESHSKNEQSLVYLAFCVCTLQITYYVMYCYGFVMNANFEMNLESFFVSYFALTDLYSGVPPFLLLTFSKPIREDVARLMLPLSRSLQRIEPKVSSLSSNMTTK